MKHIWTLAPLYGTGFYISIAFLAEENRITCRCRPFIYAFVSVKLSCLNLCVKVTPDAYLFYSCLKFLVANKACIFIIQINV